MNCANCQKSDTNLMLCANCKQVSYCGKECQVTHWATHKQNCKKESKKEEQAIPTQLLEQLGYMAEKEEEERRKHEEYLKNPVHDYDIQEEIGSGNFTTIHLAIEKSTGRRLAVKIAEKQKVIKKHKERDLLVEKHCLNKAKNIESVVRIEKTFQDSLNLYIVMELVDGKELWEYMNIFGFKNKKTAYSYFIQILKTVEQLHKIGIVHRDLKPENILVRKESNLIKIIDFGSSKDIIENIASQGNSSTGRKYFEHYMGTPNYMAPECIHNKFSDKRCDVYSLGCIFYNLLVGLPCFIGGSEYLIFKAALEEKPVFYDMIFEKEETEIITRMLDHDATKRPTVAELIPIFEKLESKVTVDEELVEILTEVIEKVKLREMSTIEEVEQYMNSIKQEFIESYPVEKHPFIFGHLELLKRQSCHYLKLKDFEHQPI